MSLELIKPEETFEVSHSSGAVFICRHWTNAMQDSVDQACVKIENGKPVYNASLARAMLLELSVVGWRGVTSGGQEVPCSPENVKNIPFGAMIWLQTEIETKAGLRVLPEEKKS